EIAYQKPIDKRGPFRAGLAAAEHARRLLGADTQRAFFGDGVSRGIHGAHSRREGIDEATLRFLNSRLRQVGVAKIDCVFGKTVSEVVLHDVVPWGETYEVSAHGLLLESHRGSTIIRHLPTRAEHSRCNSPRPGPSRALLPSEA